MSNPYARASGPSAAVPDVLERGQTHRDRNVERLLENTSVIRAQNGSQSAGEYAALMQIVGHEPRDRESMVREARDIGQRMGKTGFYRFPAGKSVIEGASIDLAYALAQAWGRCITRCVVTSSSESRVSLRGIFVDLLTMAICERDYQGFVAPAPAKFASSPDQAERWRTMQEQAAISKAVRGAILGGLPTWYTDAGLQAAMEAADSAVLRGSDGKPLSVADARAFAVSHWTHKDQGFTREDLEAWTGVPIDLWGIVELTDLVDEWEAIGRGTSSLAAMRATIDEARGAASAAAAPKGDDGKDPAGVKRTRGKGKSEQTDPPAGEGKGAVDAGAGGKGAEGKATTKGEPTKSDAPRLSPEVVQLVANIRKGAEILGAEDALDARRYCGVAVDAKLEEVHVTKLRELSQRMNTLLDVQRGDAGRTE